MARVALLCAFATTVAGNAVELTPDNFDKEVLQSGKSAFIKFLAPWSAPRPTAIAFLHTWDSRSTLRWRQPPLFERALLCLLAR